MTTPADIVNQSLQQIAAQASVSGPNPTFDGTAAGNAAGILYTPCVNLLLRTQDFEFSRKTVGLSGSIGVAILTNVGLALLANTGAPILAGGLSGYLTPQYPWQFAYLYPSDCIRIRSVLPATWDKNDPQAVRWSEVEMNVSGLPTRAIQTNVPSAVLTYTSNAITEDDWSPDFREVVVRTLASELVMALGGRPDLSAKMLQQAGGILQTAGAKDS